MTSKEKSTELANKFHQLNLGIKLTDCALCALISVDEIIEAIGGEKMSNHPKGIYWQQVKQELTKL